MTSCSIWIDKESKKEIINDVFDFEEGDCLYQGHEIDELYLEKDGKLSGFINIGPIGVAIDIEFDEWFQEFKKHKAFDCLRQVIEARILQQEVTLGELKNMFAYHVDTSVETVKTEEN